MSNNMINNAMPGSVNQNYVPSENRGFNQVAGKKPRWDANIKWFDVPADNNWHRIRFMGPLHMVGVHWFETKTKKKFPMFCLNYDSSTSSFDTSRGCPACALDPKNSTDPKIKSIAARQQGYIHVIDRSTRNFAPMRLPISAIIGVKKQGKLNVHTVNGVSYEMDVTDPKYGQDINIHYDQSADPASRYTISLAGHTPLTEEEMGHFNRMVDWGRVIDMPPKSEVERALRENNYGLASGRETLDLGVLPQVPVAPVAPSMPPLGTYVTPTEAPRVAPVAPTPQNFAPPVVPPAAAPWSAPAPAPAAPVAPAPAPAPVAPAPAPWTPPTASGFQVAAEEVTPVAPVMPNPNVMATMTHTAPITPTPVAPAATAGRSFNIVGRPGPVGIEEFQAAITTFAQPIAKAMPMKVWDRDDVAGLSVPKCMGAYTGDTHCMKCPVRRYCLTY